MSDAHLRELERRAVVDPGARVDWIRAWLQAGSWSVLRCRACGGSGRLSKRDVDRFVPANMSGLPCPNCDGTGKAPRRTSVELAAFLGDEDCRRVVESFPCPVGCSSVPCDVCADGTEMPSLWGTHATPVLASSLFGLTRYGHEVMVRAALAAGERVLPVWEEEEEHAADHPRRALATVRAWLADPSNTNRETCWNVVDGTEFAQGIVWSVAPCHLVFGGGDPDGVFQSGICDATHHVPQAEILAAIRDELVPWALGAS